MGSFTFQVYWEFYTQVCKRTWEDGVFFCCGVFLDVFSTILNWRIVRRINFIGVKTTPVIVLTGLFTGMVLALQTYYALSKFGAESSLGPVVALSLIRELGPVISA